MLLHKFVSCLAMLDAFFTIVSFLVVTSDLGVDADFSELLLLFFKYFY